RAAQCWRDVLLQQIDDPQQIDRLRALGHSPSWRWGCYDSVNATSGDLPSNYLSGDVLKRLIGVGGLRRATRQRVMMDVTDNEHDDGAGETECSDDTCPVTRHEQGQPNPRRAQHNGK